MQTEISLLNCTQTITFQGESPLYKESCEIGTEMDDLTGKITHRQ